MLQVVIEGGLVPFSCKNIYIMLCNLLLDVTFAFNLAHHSYRQINTIATQQAANMLLPRKCNYSLLLTRRPPDGCHYLLRQA